MSYRSALLLITCVTYLTCLPNPAKGLPSELKVAASPNQSGPTLGPDLRLIAFSSSSLVAQASATTTLPFQPGSQNQEIAELQRRLNTLGFYDSEVDGLYGEQTRNAVAAFQRSVGLNPDGLINFTTWDRIQEAYQAETSSTAEANSAAESETTAESDTPEGEPAEAPAPPRRFPFLLLGLLALLGGIGWLIYALSRPSRILNQKRVSSSSRETQSSHLSSSTGLTTGVAAESGTTRSVSNGSNGYASSSVVSLSSSVNAEQAASNTSSLEETTRLAKINIVDELINDLHDPDRTKRRKAIWELGQRGNSLAVQPLVDLMSDSDSKQRSLILAALSEIGMRTLKPMNRALMISLQDESADVRKNAIRDLTRIYDQVAQISQLLVHAVDDQDVEVQETARWALGQLNRIRVTSGIDGVPALQSSVQQPESLPESSSPVEQDFGN